MFQNRLTNICCIICIDTNIMDLFYIILKLIYENYKGIIVINMNFIYLIKNKNTFFLHNLKSYQYSSRYVNVLYFTFNAGP